MLKVTTFRRMSLPLFLGKEGRGKHILLDPVHRIISDLSSQIALL